MTVERKAPFLDLALADWAVDAGLTFQWMRLLYDQDDEWRASFLQDHKDDGTHDALSIARAAGEVYSNAGTFTLRAWSEGVQACTHIGAGICELRWTTGLFATGATLGIFLTSLDGNYRFCWSTSDVATALHDVRIRCYAGTVAGAASTAGFTFAAYGLGGATHNNAAAAKWDRRAITPAGLGSAIRRPGGLAGVSGLSSSGVLRGRR